jgi:uncharacterized tellurite resistance protein B-like protein
MADKHVAYTCPHCEKRTLETVAILPYVRGFLEASRFGNKKIVGCRPCVRAQLLLETGRSCLHGWLNPFGPLANPVMIVYGLARSLVVARDTDGVRSALREAGIPEPETPAEPVRLAYRLAAAMIAADGKILPEEMEEAARIGQEIFADFDVSEFRAVAQIHGALPEPAELASILKSVLSGSGRADIYRYLLAIAAADREIAPEERRMLRSIADNLGIDGAGQGMDLQA